MPQENAPTQSPKNPAVTDLVIILVSPKTPGNVGAAARAMLNMGAAQLRLVAPRCDHLCSEARALAVHAESILEQAVLYPTLRDALLDRDLSIGTSARQRGDLPAPQHPTLVSPLVQQASAPALVFGPEETGLINSDLEQCQITVRVPTADYASLNLAQAVLLVCYEFLQTPQTPQQAPPQAPQMTDAPDLTNDLPHDAPPNIAQPPKHKLATRQEVEGMYQHLHDVMHEIGYTDAMRARHTMRMWRALLDRAHMNGAEVRLFRGLLRQVRWKIGNVSAAGVEGAHQKTNTET